jgi:hypothetical protein
MHPRVLNIADTELRSVDPARAPKGENAGNYDIRHA